METLSVLLNLPEVQSHPAEKYKQVLDFIIQPLTFDKFQIFGFNNLSLGKICFSNLSDHTKYFYEIVKN